MSHSFGMRCGNCGEDFCECHQPIYFDDLIFCQEECRDEYFNNHIGCTKEKPCQHLEDFWQMKIEKGLSELETDGDENDNTI